MKTKFFYIMAVGIGIFLLFFFVSCFWIGYRVKSQCQNAKLKYGNDCVEALINQFKNENEGFRERNNAIWALGQIGNSQALSVLQNYYTGNVPDREPLDEMISQYELKKAINLINGGINISAFVWRGFLDE